MNGQIPPPPGYEDPEEEKRKKGLGYFGKLKRPDGRVSTELSIGITGPEFNWKETEVPSLVPTLTRSEIDSLLSGGEMTPEIIEKAKQYALTRIGRGLSPFAQTGEQRSLPISQASTTPSTPPGYEEVAVEPTRPRFTQPADWKKELVGGLLHKVAKRGYGMATGEYYKPMEKREYWKSALDKLIKGGKGFLSEIGYAMASSYPIKEKHMTPGYKKWREETMTKSVMAPKQPLGKKLVEIGKVPVDFATYLPKNALELAVDPVKKIEDDPLGALVVLSTLAGGVGKGLIGKARAGGKVTGTDIHGVIRKIPNKVMPREIKAQMIEGIVPEYIVDTSRFIGKEISGIKMPRLSEISPYQKIIDALKPAKVIRKQQEALYTEVRGERFPKAMAALKKVRGRKGFEAGAAKLKGEMQKVEFEPIVQKLTQTEVESLFNQIIDSPAVAGIEKFTAGTGLAKLLGKKGGVIPTASELALLNKVFPKDFVKTILSKRAIWDKIKVGMLEGANVPRAIMASYDLSFGLRQGIFLAARYPKEFISGFLKQFELFGSEKAFKAINENIVNRKTYKLAKRGKGYDELALTEMDAALSLTEEAFFGVALAEKIPIVGRGVRASARAYTGFANKLRMDVFDHLIKSAEKVGRNPWKEPKLVDSIIRFVNAGTGRGALPKALETSAAALNTVLFSPRLMSSRLQLLNPRFYYKLDPFVRKQALQSLFAFTGMTTTVLGLAKLAGAEVSANPFSADFGKIKIGNTRIDIMGGFQQYIRTAAQFAGGKTVSTTTGKVTKTGEGYKPISRGEIVGRGLEYKLAPVASFAVGLYRGRSIFGGPFDIPTEVGKRFVPMVMQDIIDLAREDPELLPASILGIFGTGLQTYGPRKKEGVVY